MAHADHMHLMTDSQEEDTQDHLLNRYLHLLLEDSRKHVDQLLVHLVVPVHHITTDMDLVPLVLHQEGDLLEDVLHLREEVHHQPQVIQRPL